MASDTNVKCAEINLGSEYGHLLR